MYAEFYVLKMSSIKGMRIYLIYNVIINLKNTHTVVFKYVYFMYVFISWGSIKGMSKKKKKKKG